VLWQKNLGNRQPEIESYQIEYMQESRIKSETSPTVKGTITSSPPFCVFLIVREVKILDKVATGTPSKSDKLLRTEQRVF
jgi:hypothetical protein